MGGGSMSIFTRRFVRCDSCHGSRRSECGLPKGWFRLRDFYGNEVHVCDGGGCLTWLIQFKADNWPSAEIYETK